ncbi:helix-turn-helix domain-containing protein [Streptomyces cuspidosporus]|uniref:Helix-turn-helix domain-containing protein n=1 Tax=Streptomyces cuspidosporus TaxID=66882 RepID=A0ABP5SJT0_9ACTN
MILTSLTTDDLPQADRFGWWREMTASAMLPSLLDTDRRSRFRATADLVDLGGAQVTAMTYHSLTSLRTPKLIRQRDPESCLLSLTVHGTMTLSHCGREATAGVHQLLVFSSSRPFHGSARAEDRPVSQILAQIPRSLIPVRPQTLDQAFATRIPAADAFGELLAHFLTQVTNRARQYRTSDRARLSAILVDLLSGLLAHRLEAEHELPAESRRRALFLEGKSVIQQRLGDPALSTAEVAAALHISPRSLNRLFESNGLTVSDWIRRQRLEGARHDLSDPAQRGTAVCRISARWGFSHPAAFSRAFRRGYGCSPQEYRQQALTGTGAPG